MHCYGLTLPQFPECHPGQKKKSVIISLDEQKRDFFKDILKFNPIYLHYINKPQIQA